MNTNEIKTAIRNIETAVKNVEGKKFKIMFFVADSKGTPIGSLAYTYELAYKLQELGYKVQMLYSEKDFVGVKEWLGEKYANLTHLDLMKDNVDVSPQDFLFIPELFTNVMTKTKNLPCKKIAILQNFGYLTDLIPLGSSWTTFGIKDCITTSESLKERLNEIFPDIRTYVIRPSIDKVFKPKTGNKLIVNIISKDENDINTVIKPFKWRFPIYDFVTFRYIHGRSREELAKFLSDSAITVWIDTDTDFGYTALEAMASGNIVIGKIPENEPEWMTDKNKQLVDNGVWCYKTREIPQLLASAIQTVLYSAIPDGLYRNMEETVAYYSDENQKEDIETVFSNIFKLRDMEFQLMLKTLKNNLDNSKE